MNKIRIEVSFLRCDEVNRKLLGWVELYGGALVYCDDSTFLLELPEDMDPNWALDELVGCEVVNPIEDIYAIEDSAC